MIELLKARDSGGRSTNGIEFGLLTGSCRVYEGLELRGSTAFDLYTADHIELNMSLLLTSPSSLSHPVPLASTQSGPSISCQ